MVSSLKASGLWDSLTDIYPLVGSTATSQAVNLKTPGVNPLVFVSPGASTFSSLGYNANSLGYGYCTTAPQKLSSFSLAISVTSTALKVSDDVVGLSTAVPFVAVDSKVNYSWFNSTTYSDIIDIGNRIETFTPGGTLYTGTWLLGGNHRVFNDGALMTASPSAAPAPGLALNFWSVGSNSGRTYNFLAMGTEISVSAVATLNQIIKAYRP